MMNKLIPVEGRPDLFRDPSTNAIINTSKSGAKVAREARENAIKQQEELEQLKADVGEIKSLLKELLERK